MFDLQGYGPSLLEGALLTIQVALSALVLAIALGMLGALAKLSGSRLAYGSAAVYTTVIRGIPDLVLMLLIFFGGQVLVNDLARLVGYTGYIDINPFVAGVLTIGFIFGAYMTETFRGAILAVPAGQLEAGYAFGMRRRQVFFRILLPQMIRHALPGFGNNWIDLTGAARIINSRYYSPYEAFITAALFYMALTFAIVGLFKLLERRWFAHLRPRS